MQLTSHEETITTLQAQLADRDRAIGVLKEKTKEYIQKLNSEHQSNIKKLEDDNRELHNSVTALVEERVSLKDRILSLESSSNGSAEKMASFAKTIDELSTELRMTKEALSAKESESAAQTASFKEREDELVNYRQKVAAAESELREAREARGVAERALIAAREEAGREMRELADRLTAERERVEAAAVEKAEQYKRDIEQLKETVAYLSANQQDARIAALTADLDQMSLEKAGLEMEVSGLQARVAEYESRVGELGESSAEAEALRAKLAELTAQADQMSLEKAGLEMEVSGLQARVAEYERRVGELGESSAEAEALRAKLAELTSQADQMSLEKAGLEMEVSGLQARVAEYERRVGELGESSVEAEALRAKLAELTSQAHQMSLEKAGLEMAVSRLQARVVEYESRVGELGESSAEAEALRAKLAELTADLDKMSLEKHSRDQEVSELLRRVSEYETQIDNLTRVSSELESSVSQLNDIQSKYDALNEEKSALDKRIISLEQIIETAKSKMKALFTQSQGLQEELKTTKEALSAKESESAALTASLKEREDELINYRQKVSAAESELREAREARGVAERALIAAREEAGREMRELADRLTAERERVEAAAVEKAEQYTRDIEHIMASMTADSNSLLSENAQLQQNIRSLESQYNEILVATNSEREALSRELKEKERLLLDLKEMLDEKTRNEGELQRLYEESKREIDLMRSKRMNARNETIEMAQSLDKMRSEATDLSTLIKYNLIPLVYEQIYTIESLLMGFDVVHSYLVTRTKGKRVGPPRARSRTDGARNSDNEPHGSPLEHAQTLQSELYRLQTGITLMNQSLQSMQDVIQNDNPGCCSSGSILELVAQSPAKSRGYRTVSSQEIDRVKLTLMRDDST